MDRGDRAEGKARSRHPRAGQIDGETHVGRRLARARCARRLHAGARSRAPHLVCARPRRPSPQPIIIALAAPVVIEADATPNPGGWPKGGQTVVDLPQRASVLCHHLVRAGGGAARRLSRLSYFQGPARAGPERQRQAVPVTPAMISFPRGARRPGPASPTCCWPAWRPMAGSICPQAWPQFRAAEIAAFAGKPYQDVAFAILSRFAGDAFTDAELKADIDAAYAGFDAPAHRAAGRDRRATCYLLELFHGPTLAFKDIALQMLGRLFARALAQARRPRHHRGGDVAATPARPPSRRWAGCPISMSSCCIRKGRVSEVQRRQMTTAPHANVHNIALEGSFDDAQAIVKALFADTAFAARDRPDRGQFDQLRAHRGAMRLLLHRHGAAGQARDLRRAHRQFRRHLRRRGGDAHGPGRRNGW